MERLPTDIFGKKDLSKDLDMKEGGRPSNGNTDICKPEFVSISQIIGVKK